MPFLADLLAALAAGLATFIAARWYAHSPSTPAQPAEEVARAVGEAVRPHPGLRAFFVRRLDRSATTGLLLTLALAITVVGAFLLGVLAVLVRRVAAIQHVDNSVAAWGYDHRSSDSTSALQALTNLGNIRIVVGLALLLVVVDFYRCRSRWPFLFLLTVLAGMEVSMLVVKDLVGRLRPTLNPAAASLGPSFPSGHSATAAAFYAAAALVIGASATRPRTTPGRRDRGRDRRGRRGEPRAARSPLALRCRRRPRDSAGRGSRSPLSSSAAGCSSRPPQRRSPGRKPRMERSRDRPHSAEAGSPRFRPRDQTITERPSYAALSP